MDLQLAGKTAIVTGGSKGIGIDVVRRLLDEGVRVVAASRSNTAELKEADAVHVAVDLTTEEGAQRLAEAALAELGGIDILINNVGVGDPEEVVKGATHTLLDLPEDAWRHTFDLHFYSALRVTKALLPSLVQRQGTVVNVSSVAARIVSGAPFHYSVAKAALNALTKVVSDQFAPQGVRAITVSPGPVSTGVWTDPDGVIAQMARHSGVGHEQFQADLMDSIGSATGRISTPDEVARLIVFAASPNNITGNELLVDGGTVKHV